MSKIKESYESLVCIFQKASVYLERGELKHSLKFYARKVSTVNSS